MRNRSPTRRAVIASVAAAPTLLPAIASAGQSPDTRLLELGQPFRGIVNGLEDCEWSDDSLLIKLDAVEGEILRINATTMEGLFVKASAACWALLGDLDCPSRSTSDVRMSLSIIRDLVRCFDPTLEKPGALRKLLDEIELGATGPDQRKGMYGLVSTDYGVEIEFDEAGRMREHKRGTGKMHLCDVGIDGTLLCYGAREKMQKMADDLMDDSPWEYRAVPLPWAGAL